MKRVLYLLFLSAVIGTSCSIPIKSVFGKKTPHEKYEEKLDDKGLNKTPEGRQWLAASKKALEDPQLIQLPYKQHGYFHPDKPRALGLQFNATQGERLTFTVTKKTGTKLPLYADIFKGDGSIHLLATDTASSQFSFDVTETGTFILRLQPELFRTGEYSLSVSVGPSLLFPVSGDKAKVQSFWGAARDGGKRKHEGIDIFAPKRTPAIAAADGFIIGVRDGGIGGKVVYLRPKDKSMHFYYAHLDEHLVREGQVVNRGDVIGLVGNTGNAQTSSPHLHFGVYTQNGPVDPFPFVNTTIKTAAAVPEKSLTSYLKLVKAQKTADGSVAANTLLVPVAVTAKVYIAELPDGKMIQAPFASVQVVKQPVKQTGVVVIPSTPQKKS